MVYWITWQIGTMSYSEWKETYEVLSMDMDRFDIKGYCLMDLEDGWNPPEILADRIRMVLADLGAGKRVIIMCAAGISRSNGFAMGVLSVFHKLAFDDAERIVKKLCPRANPMPDLLDAIKEAIKLLDTKT